MNTEKRIDTCIGVRTLAANEVIKTFKKLTQPSELEFCASLTEGLKKHSELYGQGWYDPPPGGVVALFSDEKSFSRVLFDTLRKEEFWPNSQHIFNKTSVGFVYCSPVDRPTGIIGDFAVTVYRGTDIQVQEHLKRCLAIVERAAEFAKVGMEFREIHNFSQKLLFDEGLSNRRTLTYTDKVGTNIGHTIPWSYEDPTPEEEKIISSQDFNALKKLISSKRINLNKEERFKVPKTIAFTVELRIEDPNDSTLPNTYSHVIVTFKSGTKKVVTNFNPVFEVMGMHSYLVSRFNT